MSVGEKGMKKSVSFGEALDKVRIFTKSPSGLSSLQRASRRASQGLGACAEQEKSHLLISPSALPYRVWWYFTTICSLFTGFFTPWEVAFESRPGLSPYDDSPAVIEYILSSVFLVDIIVHFFLQRKRPNGLMETSWKSAALHYLRTWFIIDLLGVIPFAAIVAEFEVSSSLGLLRRVGLLRLLRLVRLHRVFRLFGEFEANVHISLVATTLIRNMTIVVLVGHFAGCMFYFISLWYGFGGNTWIGDNLDLEYMSRAEKYIYSFYFSITTMTTVGYGDFSPGNTAEVVFGTIYMLFNIVLNSYILGTITMVVIKADENNGHLRLMFSKLKYFSELNDLEKPHKQMLKNYIEFNLANPDIQDDDLLKSLPHGARRSVLKNLYVPLLETVDILEGTSKGFLLRLLEYAEIDIYMPNQVIIPRGDYVHELNIMLTGQAFCSKGGSRKKPENNILIDEGSAFLTENFINLEEVKRTVRSHTICRVLIIPRASYIATCDEFPKDKIILDGNREILAKNTLPSPELQTSIATKTNGEQGNETQISWEDEENNVANSRSALARVSPASLNGVRTADSATPRN